MYDHERSLVSEMDEAGKPFALIGVNFNDELDAIKAAVKEKNLNWRSFFCGTDGTIPESYDVVGFPTVVIIDANGVVRSKAHEPQDDVIDQLLAEIN